MGCDSDPLYKKDAVIILEVYTTSLTAAPPLLPEPIYHSPAVHIPDMEGCSNRHYQG